jgi:hypothetical protein
MGIALRRALRCPDRLRSRRYDDVGLERDDFCREAGEAIRLAFGAPPFNRDVLAVDVTEFTQPVPETIPGRVVFVSKDRDPVDSTRRLGDRRL